MIERRVQMIDDQRLEWMRKGADPPAGFSVYLARYDEGQGIRSDDNAAHILLPDVTVGPRQLSFQTWLCDLRGMTVRAVWQPRLADRESAHQ